ncbi:MAG: PAS domain S-box protein, partial [Betaproteobacteria bacterium]
LAGDDARRLALLQMLDLVGPEPEPALDRLARIAAAVTGAEIAMITFIAGERQWIRSRVGTQATEAVVSESFCIGALAGPALFEVVDAEQDPRFAHGKFVRGPRTIRSYAGQPIVFDGLVIGTVCVLDARPRRLGEEQRAILGDLAGMVEELLQSRHKQVLLNREREHAVELAAALSESEAMLAQAQRLARLGSWEVDLDGGGITWSAVLYDLFERDPALGPIRVEDFRERVDDADRPAFDAVSERAFVHLEPTDMQFRYTAADGGSRWINAVSEPARDATGRIVRLRGTLQDITERKESERLVRESAERDRLLWQTTTDVVMMVGEDNLIRFCNPAVTRLLGYLPDEVVGQPLSILQPQRMRAAHQHGFERYIATGVRHVDWRAVEVPALHRDGHEIPVEVSFSDMQIDGRRIFGAFMRDITPRVQQQQALQRSEERYRRIVQTAEEGIWMIDAASVTTFVNPKMARMLGYAPEEMLGRSMYDFMDERAREAAREIVRRRAQGIAEQHDFRLSRKDGSDLWTAMSTSPALDEHGAYAGALAMVTDITQRRLAEDALRESEERFRSLTMLSSDWYWEHDSEFRLTQVVGGRAYDNSVGLRRAIGQRPWEAASAGMDPADWDAHRQTLEAHEPFRDFEISHEAADGQLQTVSVSGEPVFGADGAFVGYRGVGRDITEQRRGQAVRLELEAQLREAQKMEAIGVLAGGIAHDFNNVLAGILGNIALAMQDLPAGHPAFASLEQIRKASLRGRGLVQQILAFARRQPREVVSCELRPLVEEGIGLLRSTLPAGVALDVTICAEPLYVMADATQVEQVLMNLCTNAWHSLAGSPGRVAVTLARADLGAAAARNIGANLAPGTYARLSVQDDGRGMNAETRARIFEPFFTTKPVGEGTGLGLAVAHGIVAAHGGAIRVLTAEGLGSTFEIYLPRTESTPAADRPTPLAIAHRGHGERVLYIDDDEVMVVMVERLLERLGYAVTCLHDPATAIDAVRAAPQAFDVVVTDLNMPELSGLDVARAVQRIRPDLPVIISSGNIPDRLQEEARQAGVRGLVHKQFTLEELGAVVHWVLAGGQRLGLEPLQMSSR